MVNSAEIYIQEERLAFSKMENPVENELAISIKACKSPRFVGVREFQTWKTKKKFSLLQVHLRSKYTHCYILSVPNENTTPRLKSPRQGSQ